MLKNCSQQQRDRYFELRVSYSLVCINLACLIVSRLLTVRSPICSIRRLTTSDLLVFLRGVFGSAVFFYFYVSIALQSLAHSRLLSVSGADFFLGGKLFLILVQYPRMLSFALFLPRVLTSFDSRVTVLSLDGEGTIQVPEVMCQSRSRTSMQDVHITGAQLNRIAKRARNVDYRLHPYQSAVALLVKRLFFHTSRILAGKLTKHQIFSAYRSKSIVNAIYL